MRRPTECGHLVVHKSCAACKAIEAVYYKKLSDLGFEDIEDSKRMLKSWHSFRFGQPTVSTKRKKLPEEYYERARDLLFTYRFKKTIHKVIWELHSEGKSQRQIASILAESRFEWKLTRGGVFEVIKRISKEIKF